MHATSPPGYRFSKAQSKRSPVEASIASLNFRTVGVNGAGDITLPLYARPPMPSSAIQHVSRRSSTRLPSRVTSFSALNGTSAASASTVSEKSKSKKSKSEIPESPNSPRGVPEEVARSGSILNGRPSAARLMTSPARLVAASHPFVSFVSLVEPNRPSLSHAHAAGVASCGAM